MDCCRDYNFNKKRGQSLTTDKNPSNMEAFERKYAHNFNKKNQG